MELFKDYPHIVESQQFPLCWLNELFQLAKKIRDTGKTDNAWYHNTLHRKVMVTLFYEPSTRTRFFFEMAMLRQGGNVISTENATAFSSAIKGESLEDTIQVVSDLGADVIVLRHPEAGSAARAASVQSVSPIINGGDGNNQHPTQSLTDFFTIQDKINHRKERPLAIAMLGDLANGRTVRSLSYLLAKFANVVIYFVSPPEAGMKEDIKDYLAKHTTPFFIETDLKKVAPLVDVLYATRVQKERGTDQGSFGYGSFVVTGEIADSMQDHAIIMHPLPMNNEIAPEVRKNKRAFWFQQAQNGLYIRMALLQMLLTCK